jgi:hypothetical protein
VADGDVLEADGAAGKEGAEQEQLLHGLVK